MWVSSLAELEDSVQDVRTERWRSIRFVLADRGLGYSFHDSTIYPGTRLDMHYVHHIETVYCISGDVTLIERESGTRHAITAGSVYLLDKHDEHTLVAHTELRIICVFTPGLHGAERHDAHGAYPPPAADEPGGPSRGPSPES